MSRDSAIEYWGHILFKAFSAFLRLLPIDLVFILARSLGSLGYYIDIKHRSIAYANIKTAFGEKLKPQQLAGIAKRFYRAFAQNFIEVFLLPAANEDYLKKYLAIEGVENIVDGFKKGKGVILAVVHEGDWELSNIICASLGFPFVLIINERRYKRLNKIINHYRAKKNCLVVSRDRGLQEAIEALKNNRMLVLTTDQGGKTGIGVDFFGRQASMSVGAVKLAVKYQAQILPVYFTRVKGPYVKVKIYPPMEVKRTPDTEKDIRDNMQALAHIFERIISENPQEYLWAYKIWKYGRRMNILVLSDGKVGHLRQAESAAKIAARACVEREIEPRVDTVEIKFKRGLSRAAVALSALLAQKSQCQGCLWCLRRFLKKDVYEQLARRKYDIIISCGAALAPVNYILAQENMAKSVVIMRPALLSAKRFDLAIIPRHDRMPCPGRKDWRGRPRSGNIVVTDGAFNTIEESYLKEMSERLVQTTDHRLKTTDLYVGLLLGGDTKKFRLDVNTVREVIRQIKSAAEKQDINILATTSRRTPAAIEKLAREELGDYPRCKLLVIANEKNIPGVVYGILGLSGFIITSPESISMVCEAASSKKYALVFRAQGLSKKHLRLLEDFAAKKYIYLAEAHNIGNQIEKLWQTRPAIFSLRNNPAAVEEIKKLI